MVSEIGDLDWHALTQWKIVSFLKAHWMIDLLPESHEFGGPVLDMRFIRRGRLNRCNMMLRIDGGVSIHCVDERVQKRKCKGVACD